VFDGGDTDLSCLCRCDTDPSDCAGATPRSILPVSVRHSDRAVTRRLST